LLMTERGDDPTLPMPPACADLMVRLQLVLDGELSTSAFEPDAHAASCPACRERILAARLILESLSAAHSSALPPGLTDSILAVVREDRFSRVRRRSSVVAGGAIVAIAASQLLAIWLFNRDPQSGSPSNDDGRSDVAHVPALAPEPRSARLGAAIEKVGQTIVDTAKPIADPVIGAPRVLDWFAGTAALPADPPAGFEQTRDALAELPEVARTGLEPVTSTTQKAFARLLRDVGSVQISTRPKS
jgi:hypothetical protein